MTFACQKRGGEVTPSAYDDGEGRRRRGEWGHEPSFPEVGGDAIRYFPPGDVDALTDVMNRVLSDQDEGKRLSMLGRRRAKDFTWSKTAEMTALAYENLLSGVR